MENPYAWMRSADLFVLSSDHEGFGIVLAEAQGLGMPAVSTNCEFGPEEIVEQDVTGLLVPTGQPDRLGQAMQTLLAEPERRRAMGDAGRLRSRRMFDVSVLRDQLTEMLQP